ncbi:MAG TPA: CPBP family intramembrane glutamic endopeptidase [Erysipelothrix sp.]
MKKKLYILIAVALMIFVDSRGGMSYFQRSLIKIILFGFVPFIMLRWRKEALPNLKSNQYLKYIIGLSLVIIVSILLGAYGLNHYGLFDQVQGSLAQQVGVTKYNYPFVFIYIVLINGPLEEFFFRHFSYESKWHFKGLSTSLLFSLYHVGMLFTMFDWYLFLLAMSGLVLVSLFFIAVNTRKHSILNSILLHMAANFAINLVGWFLIMN